ncbi:MAG: ATP-binding protein [Gaiellaceae bacterium]
MTAQADRERLAILVHEVRSSVAALAAIAEIYSDPSLDLAERRSLATLSVDACRAIERVVTDATVASVRLGEVDIARLVAETVGAAILRGGNVRAVVDPGLPFVEADPLRVKQALDNLVSNALTYSGAAHEVVVSADEGDGHVRLSVSDEGEGIPIEEQERIFEAGVRLDVRRPGSGLGLAVARAVAKAHGGELTLESAPGEGATFTLALPFRARTE